ncbi:MAG TPA: signal peptidase I, partial [Actinomycetaceae bacterium]|nr:signal peptidase I [Actinomycetaceae bacterium]
TVECCDDSGRILVNGQPVDEPYLYPGDAPSSREFSVTVPQDHFWFMGDHRSNSQDSRAQQGGPGGGSVPLDNIVGKAFLVMWPLDHFTVLETPSDAFSDVPEAP